MVCICSCRLVYFATYSLFSSKFLYRCKSCSDLFLKAVALCLVILLHFCYIGVLSLQKCWTNGTGELLVIFDGSDKDVNGKGKGKAAWYSCSWNTISQLRGVTCHMGSHSVTRHPTQVSTPRLHPSQSGRYSIYLPRRDGRLS